jgi:hypothetical protein
MVRWDIGELRMSADPRTFTGDNAHAIFIKSKLPFDVLGQIWCVHIVRRIEIRD